MEFDAHYHAGRPTWEACYLGAIGTLVATSPSGAQKMGQLWARFGEDHPVEAEALYVTNLEHPAGFARWQSRAIRGAREVLTGLPHRCPACGRLCSGRGAANEPKE